MNFFSKREKKIRKIKKQRKGCWSFFIKFLMKLSKFLFVKSKFEFIRYRNKFIPINFGRTIDHRLNWEFLHNLIGVIFLHEDVFDEDEESDYDFHDSTKLFLNKFIYDKVHSFKWHKSSQHRKVPTDNKHFQIDLIVNNLK